MLRDRDEMRTAELEFEEAKAKRAEAIMNHKMALAKEHTKLIARRDAGEKLTQSDIENIKIGKLTEPSDVLDTYYIGLKCDSDYRIKKIIWHEFERDYFGSKGQ